MGTDHEIFEGGQGREPEDIGSSGAIIVGLLLGGIAVLAMFGIHHLAIWFCGG